jgi:integrase
LESNPARGIKPIPEQEVFPRYLTQEEVRRLLEVETDPDFRRLWRFLILAGCRRSEALQISRRDIDASTRRIIIRATKNKRAKQIIITPDLAALLQEIPAQVGRLFPWRPDTVTHHFQATARKAGLTCRLHDLRHTYGSWLAMAGVKIQVIKDLMGHRDIKTTLLYSHLSPENLEEAAGKVKIGEN